MSSGNTSVNGESGATSIIGGGSGGGGGAHGSLVVSTSTNNSVITGGAGGNGGAGDLSGGGGGGGGAGGYGVVVNGSNLSYTNSDTITGGAGGSGGNGGTYGNGGSGGSGGVGVYFTGSGTLINSSGATITGGAGGMAGSGEDAGTDGAGGIGIVGSNLTIINAGTITGGASGEDQAAAILFTGGANSLELQAGSSISGVVDATAGAHDTLILGGTGTDTFNVSQIGDGSSYQGFEAFEKTGTGTWSLGGSTSAVTPWILSGGTLSIGEDYALGDASGGLTFNGGTLEVTYRLASSRAITLAGAGTIKNSSTSMSGVVLNGAISGPGSLTLTGTGVGPVKLNHANTYEGGTNVYTDVDVTTTGALGTGAVVVQGGMLGGDTNPILTFQNYASAGALSIRNSQSGVTTFEHGSTAGSATITNAAGGATSFIDDASAGSATINNQSGGILAMADQGTAAGATVVNAAGGTVDISHVATSTSIGSLSGAGNVFLGGKALTLGALGNNDTIDGVIADGGDAGGTGGSLIKAGAGLLILNGVNTYTGGTTVNAGTLEVGDANHASASIQGGVQVNAGGTLRGHGTVNGDVTNTGIVWPGGSIGTLTISGNYTQSPSGILQLEVSPTEASQLKVGGTATLAGTLSLLYAPGTYSNVSYTLLSASAVNGSFSTVTSNAPEGVSPILSNGADVLNLSITGSAPVVVAPTQATIFGAMGASALRAGQAANEVLLGRLAGPCAAANGSAGTANASNGHVSSSCPGQDKGLWIQAQGTDTRIDGNHGAPDVRDQHYGFLTGFDRAWRGMTVGLAGGYSHGEISESGNGSRGTLDTLRIAGYGAKHLGPYTLAATLGYAYDFASTTRSFGALGSARGDGHGQEFSAGLQASRAWQLSPAATLTPRIGLRYAYLDGLSTNESGPTAQNLGVGNQHLQSLQPYVGLTLDYAFTLAHSARPASVQLRAGYAYETLSTGRNVSVTAADGTGFTIAGTRDSRGQLTAGLGATLPLGKSTRAYLRYDAWLHTGNVSAQALQAGVDYRF